MDRLAPGEGEHTIGRITTTETVTSYTGRGINGPSMITGRPGGPALWFTNQSNDSIGRITTAATPQVSR